MKGFERGRNLNKLGMHAQDTAELFFDNVEVPAENVLGEPGKGFMYLTHNLAQERFGMAIGAVAVAKAALLWNTRANAKRLVNPLQVSRTPSSC
jgi:acyl-CoA dehydrogenase